MKHTISLTYSGWQRLKEKIVQDYGAATVLISWRLREQVGFTVREHYEYITSDNWNPHRPIRLDFWNEQLQTLFLLKYSDYLEDQLTKDKI
jgi:hypothetical protein